MPILNNFDSNSMIHYIFHGFRSLIKFEFIENNHLFPLFAKTIRDFSNSINAGKDNQTACQSLKKKHFNNHIDTDIRFKYLILLYSPLKEMRDCISGNDPQSNDLYYFQDLSTQEITDTYLSKLENKGPENLEIDLDYYDEYYHLTKPALKFLQTNDKRIKISNDYHILFLLRMLNREDSLKWDAVKSLVEFPSVNGSLEWDQEEFNIIVKKYENNSELKGYLKELGPQSPLPDPKTQSSNPKEIQSILSINHSLRNNIKIFKWIKHFVCIPNIIYKIKLNNQFHQCMFGNIQIEIIKDSTKEFPNNSKCLIS